MSNKFESVVLFLKTFNKVSIQQYYKVRNLLYKNCPLSSWLVLPCPCSSKCNKHDKYDKAPYIVFSYHQSYKANFKAVLTCSPTQAELTPPALPQHTNKDIQHTNKDILKCTFFKRLTYN